jgi:3-oxoadipate enol-lactonase
MNLMPFAESNHAQIHYALEGQPGKPVLVLSNSLGTNFSMWDAQIPDFLKSFRVLRCDTRGHGQSSVTPGPYSIEQLAKDVLALADTLKLETFHFCGLSMGGMIGMWLALNTPQRVDKLVLCSTAAKIGAPEMWNARIGTVRTQGMKPVAAATMERWFTAAFRATNPDTVAGIQKMVEAVNPEGYAANCTASPLPLWLSRALTIQPPLPPMANSSPSTFPAPAMSSSMPRTFRISRTRIASHAKSSLS